MKSDRFTAPSFCYEPPAKGDMFGFLITCCIFGGLALSGGIGLCVLLLAAP